MAIVRTTGANASIKATAEFVMDTASDVNDLPTDVYPGSAALCIETGDVYVMNSTGEWNMLGSGSSSGGGSEVVGGNLLVKTIVDSDNYDIVLDKTFEEIQSAMKSGSAVIIDFSIDPIPDYYSNGNNEQYQVMSINDYYKTIYCYQLTFGVNSWATDSYPRYHYGD